MANYRPRGPFAVPFRVLIPTETQAKGVTIKTYTDSGYTYMGNFRTFGGTEQTVNGVYSVVNTATLETWYTDKITADCRIVLADTGEAFEVMGTPEDIERRHQFLLAKLKGVEGNG